MNRALDQRLILFFFHYLYIYIYIFFLEIQQPDFFNINSSSFLLFLPDYQDTVFHPNFVQPVSDLPVHQTSCVDDVSVTTLRDAQSTFSLCVPVLPPAVFNPDFSSRSACSASLAIRFTRNALTCSLHRAVAEVGELLFSAASTVFSHSLSFEISFIIHQSVHYEVRFISLITRF